MKGIFNTLNILLFSLFMMGVVMVLFGIFSLPEALERASIKIDQEVMHQVMPVLYWRHAVIIATLAAGIGTLFVTLRQVDRQQRSTENAPAGQVSTELPDDGVPSEKAKDQGGPLQNIEEAVSSERDDAKKAEKWLSAVCRELEAGQAALYLRTVEDMYEWHAGFAFDMSNREYLQYAVGEGLIGQVAKSGRTMQITDVPSDYMKVFSGLGSGDPASLLIVPFKDDGQVIAVAEFASFGFIDEHLAGWIEPSFARLQGALPVVRPGDGKKRRKAQKQSNTVASK